MTTLTTYNDFLLDTSNPILVAKVMFRTLEGSYVGIEVS